MTDWYLYWHTRKYKLFVNYFKFYLQIMEFWLCIFVYKRCKRQLLVFVENFFHFLIDFPFLMFKLSVVEFAINYDERLFYTLASLSAPRARDSIVALRAPFFLDLALRIHLSVFLIIWYWSSNQFYNNITDDVNYTFSQSHSISFWIQVKQEIQFT